MAKGSLTVFLSLILVSVMTLLFTMSECIRFVSIDSMAQEYTDMAVESAFSEYNPYLWTNYKILAIDLGYGTDNLGPGILETKTADYCQVNSNIDQGNNYARLMVNGCEASSYGLLTDGNGQVVVALGAKTAGYGIPSQLIDAYQANVDEINGIEKVPVEDNAKSSKNQLDGARAANAEAKRRAAEDDDPDTDPEDIPSPGSVEDDPFDAFNTIREAFSKGILVTVISEDSMSDYEINTDQLPSHRSLNTGSMEITESNGLVDKALFIDYLLANYSCYTNNLKHDGMQYELEYLIVGNKSDVQNLASVVEQILLIREAANYMTILRTPSLENQADAIAHILAGFTLNEGIIQAVKYGIIAAWAYAESTMDVRTLLSGGKIPIMKNLDQWSSDVYHLSTIADVNTKAKESDTGIGYKEYLMAFLAIRSESTLGMRALDVMENALGHTEDYKSVKMDNMLYAADMTLSFTSEEMFLSMFNQAENTKGYFISKKKYLSY
ncbi:DUF5702 domain-containing protein [Pseudobutyrivibrio sp.]|uniref:DUF5702 domain-containing protein n=1 Tax=Pseudobutyrivibrio sp. TaxID=2014367 RepID=UPI0025D4F7D0|nr:DUF5702 domain-containing protein [Pseudobutyrivibrio sp.]